MTAPLPPVRGVDGRTYRIVAGVIRNAGGPTYWQPIDDDGHRPCLLTSCTTDGDAITVNYPATAGGRITTLLVTPDETLARAGLFAGASVAADHAVIRLGRAAARLSDYVFWNGSAWVSQRDVYRPQWAAGVLTLTHAPVDAAAIYDVDVTGRGGAVLPTLHAVTPCTTSSVQIEWRDWAGQLVTTPTTDMRVHVSRGGGLVGVDPRTVDTTAYPWSNLWLFGLMEDPGQ